MIEERLSGEKTWGVEDAIKFLEPIVLQADSDVIRKRYELKVLEDKRNALNIGLVNLRLLHERAKTQSSEQKANEEVK